VYTRQKLSN